MHTPSLPSLPSLPDRYELIRQIGQGGMARVFLAHDHTTRSRVAIKVLFDHLQRQPAIVERFKREITIARRIAHPHIIQIHDLVETPDVLALVMEFVEGTDAKTHLLRHGPLPVLVATDLLDQALSALAHAHAARVLHRDVKPHNMLLCKEDSGRYVLKIADFGLARVDDLISLSTHTQALGTIEYMAPEQLDSHLIDARADLYALGVTAYEILTGKLPFTAPTPMLIAQAHQRAPRPLASALRPELPAHLDEWLVRAMAIHPHERFATATAMLLAMHEHTALRPIPSTKLCPLCRAELIRGLHICIQCEYPLELAVTQPNQGHLTLLMESNPRGRHVLTQQEQDSIIARLRADSSCADALFIDWNLGQIPVIIAKNLTVADGNRLIQLLSTPHTRELRFELLDQAERGTSIMLAYKHFPSLGNVWGVIATLTLLFCAVGLTILLRPLIPFAEATILSPFIFLGLVVSSALIGGTLTLGVLGAVRTGYNVLTFKYGQVGLPGRDDGSHMTSLLTHMPAQTRALLDALRTPHTRALYRQLLSATLLLHQRVEDAQTQRALGQILEQSTLVAEAIAVTEREIEVLSGAQLKALDVLATSTEGAEHERAHEVLRELDAAQRHITMLTAELLSLHASLDELTPAQDLPVEDAMLSRQSCALIEELATQLDATIETRKLLATTPTPGSA